MFERFTERARQVVVLAQDEARTLKHNYIGTEHILLGILREGEGVAAQILVRLGADLPLVRGRVMAKMGVQIPSASELRSMVLGQLNSVFDENDRLRAENASLRAEIDKLRGIEATA